MKYLIFARKTKKIAGVPRAVSFLNTLYLESLQTVQRFASGEGQTKLHKTMSQGEIGKLAAAQKNLAPDGR